MPLCNLIEYSKNYSDTSGSLWQFKKDESPTNNAGNPINVAMNNSSSFIYKSSILGKPVNAGNNGVLTNPKIVVPLKYLPNFFRSLEMPLVNGRIHLELSWSKDCVMHGGNEYDTDDDANNETSFKIISTKLYVPIVT